MAHSIARALHIGCAPVYPARAAAAAPAPWPPVASWLWGDRGAAAAATAPLRATHAPLVLHVCGKFHVEQRLGIPEHLAEYAPDARVLTVVCVPGDVEAWSDAARRDATATDVCRTGYNLNELCALADYVVIGNAALPRSFTMGRPA